VQYPYEVQGKVDLVSLLQETAIYLWKNWPKNMKLSRLVNYGHFTIHGECPHCSPVQSAFETVTLPFDTKIDGYSALVAVCRCIACGKFILAAIVNNGPGWECAYHYPIGNPSDEVSKDVPESIRNDFSEALRCQWVKAYNATAEMCRRVVESSCINLGAPYSKVLQKMIDWLHERGKITVGLKDVAHKVRLGGDRGAHPPEDPSQPQEYEPMVVIEKDHADAIVEFTRHFLDHVYVIPKRLPNYDFSKPKKKIP